MVDKLSSYKRKGHRVMLSKLSAISYKSGVAISFSVIRGK